MKKVLSIVAIAFSLILAACTPPARSNARAYVTSIAARSNQVTFRVEVRDPDSELDNRNVTVRVSTPGEADIDLPLELSISRPNRSITFEGLKSGSAYDVYVFGQKGGQQVQLYFTTRVFTTLSVGDEESNPIIITTTEAFLNMDSRKHYALGNDLDFEDASFAPLFTSGTPFNGSFDGRDFTIRNINIADEAHIYRSYLSIFGYASRSTIKNLKLDNVHVDNTARPFIGIHYVALIVSKISNNAFVLENIEVSNSSVTVSHNINQSVTNRNLYVGLVGSSMQGTLRNITIKDSEVNVTQNAVNGVYAGAQAATAGTYIGGAFGLIEQDRGIGIEKLAVIDTEVNYTVVQDKASLGTGIAFVGGIFGAYRSDRNTAELYSNATVTVLHTRHEETASDKLDTIFVGGIVGSMIKSRLSNVFYNGQIVMNATHALNRVHTSLIAGQATTSASNLLAGGSIVVSTTDGTQVAQNSEVYPYNWSNKFMNVLVLGNPSITIDGTLIDLSQFSVAPTVESQITSEFILDLLA